MIAPASLTEPVRLADDEIVSWPNAFVNAHVLKAFYGPKVKDNLEAVFEIRGDVVADLPANYVNPHGRTGMLAEFPDSTGGCWACYNCANGGLLSAAERSRFLDTHPVADTARYNLFR